MHIRFGPQVAAGLQQSLFVTQPQSTSVCLQVAEGAVYKGFS